ncbi:unnamed protein product [Calicophoron daubneyi]|uniref:Uncharacterized protein n=1 Tax=Calicophoron daubneyi TaxID=300641 RepID=A0AAV2TP19_CALDB
MERTNTACKSGMPLQLIRCIGAQRPRVKKTISEGDELKVGSMELAAENCSHALLFDPGWMKFAKQREEMGDSGSALNSAERDKWEFTNLDIAKALYRRAQAYSSIANWDDAESDLKMVILLQKYPNKDGLPSGGGSLAASEALLKHVRTNTSRDSAALAERLRRHRSEL